MIRKRKAQQEMEEISRMLERVLNGECIQPVEIGYEDIRFAGFLRKIRAWKHGLPESGMRRKH